MKKRNDRLLRTHALAAALYLAVATGAHAQSTTGGISGSVADGAGKTVLIQNDSGFSREVPVDAGGRYSVGNLPLGTYKVTVKEGGAAVESRDSIGVIVGKSTDVSFGGSAATTLETVSVTGARVSPIDVSTVDTRTVVTSEQLKQLPLARNAEAIALLAPGVVNNGGGFSNGPLGGSLASFGGSTASENAYYLNGFNTTDPATSLGGLTLPYGAIDQQEIFTGGYGAQYGRSNGGVINQVGKHGSNDWHFGAAVVWEPQGLKDDQTDLYWRKDSRFAGGIYQPLSETSATRTTYSAYIGGPIVKDKLFFFVAAEQADSSGTRVSTIRDTAEPWVEYDYRQTRAYAKIDWHITDNHLLEFTGAQDKATTDGDIYNYNYVDRVSTTFKGREQHNEFGPTLYLGKYTGYFGDNVIVTALYGKESVPNKLTPVGYDSSLPIVTANDTTNPQNPAYLGGKPYITNAQTVTSISSPDREYKKENLRLNLNWRLGSHSLDFGIDNQKSEGIDIGSNLSGPGYSWEYGHTADPYGLETNGLVTTAANDHGGIGAPSPALVDPTYGASGYYVIKNINSSLFSYRAEQKAYYVEDKWQVTDDLLLSLGLRGDKFTNFTPFGDAYIDTDIQWAPRIGFSWDVNGDSSLKVYGNIGRYYLGLPLSPVGLFTPATQTSTYYTYSGINADGTPVISQQLGYPVSANSRFGLLTQDIRTAVVKDIKGENQDELILGVSKQLDNGWVGGIRATYRRLNDGIDDINVDSQNIGLVAAAQAAGLPEQDGWYWDYTKTNSAVLANPGKDNVYRVIGWDGQLHELSVPNSTTGFPEFKRDYSAVEFNLERPFDGKWYAKLNYVWSHSYGTTEGQLRSDLWRTNTNGVLALPGTYTGQTAVSTTQSWDQAALMEYINGDQSNDHRHQFKLYGYYQLASEWGASANLSLISGAPRPCLAEYYGDNYGEGNHDPAGYGGSTVTGGPYHFCYNPETGNADPSPPGSHGHLGWINSLDLGLTYKPNFAGSRLAFSLNVFNVTNEQAATNVYPFSQLPDLTVNPLWNQPVAYQAPRYARLTVSYDY
jgi:outer membrane receptor for ferrienterochelin and colicin